MMSDFYKSFEDRFRGSRETIRSRLKFYIPAVQKLQAAFPESSALDIGCGRGEWLELLSEQGIISAGIDIDSQMIAACESKGLNVQKRDALSFLREQETESFFAVSAFHFVEHIDFDDLIEVTNACWRILRPGGVLIYETPNPENLTVGTTNFYLDPSHIKPLPALLLAYLAEYAGFKKILTVRLQEPIELVTEPHPHVWDIMRGVSPDYAILAQKPLSDGQDDIALESLVPEATGLTLEELCLRNANFVRGLERAILTNTTRLDDQEQILLELKSKLDQFGGQISEEERKIPERLAAEYQSALEALECRQQHALNLLASEQLEMKNHLKAAKDQFAAMVSEKQALIDDLYSSYSWKITAPLRGLMRILRGGK